MKGIIALVASVVSLAADIWWYLALSATYNQWVATGVPSPLAATLMAALMGAPIVLEIVVVFKVIL